jgi:hypothetical protein
MDSGVSAASCAASQPSWRALHRSSFASPEPAVASRRLSGSFTGGDLRTDGALKQPESRSIAVSRVAQVPKSARASTHVSTSLSRIPLHLPLCKPSPAHTAKRFRQCCAPSSSTYGAAFFTLYGFCPPSVIYALGPAYQGDTRLQCVLSLGLPFVRPPHVEQLRPPVTLGYHSLLGASWLGTWHVQNGDLAYPISNASPTARQHQCLLRICLTTKTPRLQIKHLLHRLAMAPSAVRLPIFQVVLQRSRRPNFCLLAL